MLLDNPVTDPTLALWLAGNLKSLQDGGLPAAVSQQIFALEGQRRQITAVTVPGDLTGPTAWLFSGQVHNVWFINCTESNAQAFGLWGGYADVTRPPPLGPGVVNAYFEARATAILAAARLAGISATENRRTVIAGHSQGGALAPLLLLNARPTQGNIKAITFGAPRPSGQTRLRSLVPENVCRWMNIDDPVPLLPPQSFINSQIAAFGAQPIARRLQWFIHPAQGLILTPSGTVSAGDIPSLAALPALTNFAAWLLNLNQAAVNSHRMATYVSRLTALVNAAAPRPAPAIRGAAAERPNPANRGAMNAVQKAGVAALFAQGAAQQAPMLRIPPALLFTVYRSLSVWYVAFQGQTVFIGPTKRRALAMKNLGNNLLRRMQRAGAVDVATFMQLLGAYLAAAGISGAGFQPPMIQQLTD